MVMHRSRPKRSRGTKRSAGSTISDLTAQLRSAKKALAEREELFRLFARHAPAAIAMFDRDMRYIVASNRWITDYNLAAENLVGRSHYDVFPEIPERWKRAHRRGLAGVAQKMDEDRFDRADGTVQWERWEILPWHLASGDIGGIVIFSEDITERKRAEQRILELNKELENFFDHAPVGLLWVDPKGRILRVNRAQLELLGWKREEVLGRRIVEFFADDGAQEALERLAQKGVLQNEHARFWHGSGSIKEVRIAANGLWDEGRLLYSRWFMRDVTRQMELEREILTISEREQRRLGHDLHDDLCQQLGGIQFLSESLARELIAEAPAAAPHARKIAESAQEAVDRTRELALGLSPVPLERTGLMEGLRVLARRTGNIFRVQCRFRCGKPVLVRDHSLAIHLYRIAQEAVSNAVKHGKAGRIEISLTAKGKNVRLAVTDNGNGIPEESAKNEGMGLRTMQYRADRIGGSFAAQRLPDGGTEVICTVADRAGQSSAH
jgi:PAS domain S-box-containing protein